MPTLSLHFTHQFSEDTVVVHVNGEERYRNEHVTTRRLLGLAEEVDLNVPEADVRLEVELPKRGLSASLDLAPDGDQQYVQVRLDSRELSLRRLEEPPGYL